MENGAFALSRANAPFFIMFSKIKFLNCVKMSLENEAFALSKQIVDFASCFQLIHFSDV